MDMEAGEQADTAGNLVAVEAQCEQTQGGIAGL
jgi:hypothetical protein